MKPDVAAMLAVAEREVNDALADGLRAPPTAWPAVPKPGEPERLYRRVAARNYDATRAAWPDASPWDKAVRLSRARTALGEPRNVDVQDRDGVPCLVDTDTNRSHPL